LKITAFKQKTFQIVKERTMRKGIARSLEPMKTKPTQARVIARIVSNEAGGRYRAHWRVMVEPIGIEPMTFWLQTRRSPS
jgi:hypothetical protein